jgi:SAM-dependent methyltransferase
MDDAELAEHLRLPGYPLSAKYEPRWVLENLMGPNVLWLTEALTQVMPLEPGMRVLDLGCGKAVSSIFLAKEFAVEAWATDLWISASDNWRRIGEAGLERQVYPIHAEAHALPFAHGFFDAAVSMDAYHYFGTDDLYLASFAPFLKPGARLGIVVPGLVREFEEVPGHLAPYWEPAYWSFHAAAWWRRHFERSGVVEVECADLVPGGADQWLRWLETCAAHGYPYDERELAMLRADDGRALGFVRVVARTSGHDGAKGLESDAPAPIH